MWIDLIIFDNQTLEIYQESPRVEMKFEPEDVESLVIFTMRYLLKYCSFVDVEGATGADELVFQRLHIARDLLCIIKKAWSCDGKRALSQVFDRVRTTGEPLKPELEEALA